MKWEDRIANLEKVTGFPRARYSWRTMDASSARG